MRPFTVFKKAGAEKIALKCQIEQVCRLCYFFQKERHGLIDGPPSIFRSIHLSIFSSSNERLEKLTNRKRRLHKHSGRNSQQLTMELASLVCPPVLSWFENVHYLVLAWCETIDPGLGRAEMMVTFEHCSEAYNGEPLQLLPYSDIDKIPVIIFTTAFNWFYSQSGLLIFFLTQTIASEVKCSIHCLSLVEVGRIFGS